jgi:hypothetical protein
MARDTVGKIALDLQTKTPDSRDPIELERAIHVEYEQNVMECISRALKECDSDFYIVVLTKQERLLHNVLRHYFFYRLSCPTSEYDQAVYRYRRVDNHLEFLWVVPSKDTCEMYRDHRTQVDPEEYGLLDFVLKFYDGTLDRLAKSLNGEEITITA